MPDHFAALAALSDEDLRRTVSGTTLGGNTVQAQLYAALRREQGAIVRLVPKESESRATLGFARAANRELAALLAGRDVLDTVHDGDWTMRDLLAHAIAVELRYCAQVVWSVERSDSDPLPIPETRLPCDRRSPPAPTFTDVRTGDMARVLELLAVARDATDDRLDGVDSASLDRPSRWGDLRITARERMHQIGAHLVEVLVQAEKMLGTNESESRRVVRRIAALRGLHEALTSAADLAALDAGLESLARASQP